MTAATVQDARSATSRQLLLTLLAVAIGGISAGMSVSPLFFPATILVTIVIVRGVAADVANAPKVRAKSDFLDLPAELRATVDAAFAALPLDDARRLLLAVVVQARPILASRSATFDPAAEATSRSNVESLVAACCGTALDLSRLDTVRAAKAPAERDPALDARFAAARDMLTKRLSDATAALASLYASGLEHGTPASNRVADLAAEVSADAKARDAAATELGELLG